MVSALVVGENTYGTLAEANTYLADSLRAAAWAFLDDDTKKQALITATRLIERQPLAGTKTDPAQDLHFPATGVTDCDGTAIPDDEVPLKILQAEFELAYELTQSADLETSSGTGDNNKVLKAGSAMVERFRATQGTRFPTIVHELLKCFLGGSASGAPVATGTCETSEFTDCERYGLNGAL